MSENTTVFDKSNVLIPFRCLSCSRCQEFGKTFSRAMMQNDWIHEDKLFHIVNDANTSCGRTPFSTEEVDQFITRLITEDKVMLSDGYFYPI